MVYGGIITPAHNVDAFNALIDTWRVENNMKSEMKWAKVSRNKLDKYISFVDLFFDHAAPEFCHFKSVVLDTPHIDYKTHHNGDDELAFYKFYYHFLLHKFGPYAATDDHRLSVFIDHRSTTRERLSDLRRCLNAGIRKTHGRTCDVVNAVEPRVSHECNLIQLADVLMGAIAYHCNARHKESNAARHRCDLAEHIAARGKLPNLAQATPRGADQFEVWRFRLRK